MQLNKDLVAAAETPMFLSILRRGESCGYAIIQKVRDLSGGELEWSERMFYPIPHSLEKNGLIESCWGKAEPGGAARITVCWKRVARSCKFSAQTWRNLYGMLQLLEGR